MNDKNSWNNKTKPNLTPIIVFIKFSKIFSEFVKHDHKYFFAATSLSKSNSVNNKNSLNNKMNNNGGEKQLLTNGNNSNLINNNETIKNTNNSKVSLER